MARKATTAAAPTELAPFPVETIAETQNAMAAHAAEVVEAFGDGLPWSPQHYETAIRNELRRGCDAFLRAGRFLVVARECSAHGDWIEMLGRLGIDRTHAHRMMEAARRVSALPNVARAQHLIEAAGTQSKLIELLSLPEDQFAELATDGETSGLDIDDVQSMTRDELRAAVREARAETEAARAHTAERDAKISRLQDDVAKAKRKWKAATPDEQSATLREQVDQAKQIVLNALAAESDDAGLMGALLALATHADKHRIDVRTYMGGVIAELIDTLDRIRTNDYIQAPLFVPEN